MSQAPELSFVCDKSPGLLDIAHLSLLVAVVTRGANINQGMFTLEKHFAPEPHSGSSAFMRLPAL